MNLFRVEAEREEDETDGARTWLVVADSLFEAVTLIPDGYSVKSIEVQLDAVSGPGQAFAWIGLRTLH